MPIATDTVAGALSLTTTSCVTFPSRSCQTCKVYFPGGTFPAGAHTRHVIEQALRRLGAPFDVVAESHQPEVLREMVRVGLGWTVLPPTAGHRQATSPAVGEPITRRRLVVARRGEAVPNPAGDALERALHEAVDGHGPG